jgi:hypothetical protein
VLHAVRPPPQRHALTHTAQILVNRLRHNHDIALGEQFLSRRQPVYELCNLIIAEAESFTVPLFKEQMVPNLQGYSLDVGRMYGNTRLILFT